MTLTLLHGDALAMLKTLADGSAQTCVTSPPYWGLRDYGAEGQIGLEATPEAYVEAMVAVFREVRRVLAKDGTLWLNLGDSYATAGAKQQSGRRDERPEYLERRAREHGTGQAKALTGGNTETYRQVEFGVKPKDLVGIPWSVAFALRADGWYLRSDIIWSKPNPMPESVQDRPTKAHEYVFLLAKSDRYFYNAEAVELPATGRAPGNAAEHKYAAAYADGDEKHRTKGGLKAVGAKLTKNRRTVWTISSKPFQGAHFATMPPALARPCVLAGSRPGDTVLDPFNGAGTTGLVAIGLGRSYVGIDVNADYLALTRRRLAGVEVELFKEGGAS